MASAATRARYWARSFAGWHKFSKIEPNAAHESMTRLQQRGWINDIVTQVIHIALVYLARPSKTEEIKPISEEVMYDSGHICITTR